jgi:predicted MFS family arabinose efflux permease
LSEVKATSRPEPSGQLPARLILTLAVATGLAVANLYYAQPLLAQIAHAFGAGEGQVGMVVTLTQVGYAAGLALLVPLGDILERRTLVTAILMLAALALAMSALAPSITLLALIGIAVGLSSVVAQILVPFAADLAPAESRGRVVGTVMSGLLIGILLARAVSGAVAGIWGWRAIFGLAAVLMVGLAAVLWISLPNRPASAPLSYPALLRSILTLIGRQPVLRLRMLYGALSFGAFTVFWTTAAFLLSRPPYSYGTAVIGAFGLIGAAGALMASVAGRLADRGFARGMTGAFGACILAAFLLLFLGAHSLPVLIGGIIVLDIGSQGLHITNQSVIYRLDPAARSRLTTAYMTSYFTGGAAGSALAVALYTARGWGGVCLLGGLMAAVMLAVWLIRARS